MQNTNLSITLQHQCCHQCLSVLDKYQLETNPAGCLLDLVCINHNTNIDSNNNNFIKMLRLKMAIRYLN